MYLRQYICVLVYSMIIQATQDSLQLECGSPQGKLHIKLKFCAPTS